MALYLVQHGKNLPEENDPNKGLSPEGIENSTRIAETARQYNVHVSAIWHSGKTRAMQTAQIMADIVGADSGIEEQKGMGPKDDVVDFAGRLQDHDIMLVGHMPFMTRLISHLVTGNSEEPVIKIQNSGITCLEKIDEKKWIIKWTLMPDIG